MFDSISIETNQITQDLMRTIISTCYYSNKLIRRFSIFFQHGGIFIDSISINGNKLSQPCIKRTFPRSLTYNPQTLRAYTSSPIAINFCSSPIRSCRKNVRDIARENSLEKVTNFKSHIQFSNDKWDSYDRHIGFRSHKHDVHWKYFFAGCNYCTHT